MSKDMLGIAVRKLVTLPPQTLGIVCDHLDKLADPEWVEATKKFLRKENPWESEYENVAFPVTVNYDLSLTEMIAAGKYNWTNDDITAEHFPVSGSGQVEVNVELVHFNRVIESENALKELDKAGFRPATLAELLTFGAKYPDKQREFPIIALGSVWRSRLGRRDVPVLWSRSYERDLHLAWFGHEWDEDCRFAAVRK